LSFWQIPVLLSTCFANRKGLVCCQSQENAALPDTKKSFAGQFVLQMVLFEVAEVVQVGSLIFFLLTLDMKLVINFLINRL